MQHELQTYMHMIRTISDLTCNNSKHNMQCKFRNNLNIQHDNRTNNLISENKTSNKSKNPAPVYEGRIAYLWLRRLERSREFLLERAYTNIKCIRLI